MRKNERIEVKTVPVTDAATAFSEQLESLVQECPGLSGREADLANHLFESENAIFWKIISLSASAWALTRLELVSTYYAPDSPGEQGDAKADDLRDNLTKLCEAISNFFQEGIARQEVANRIDRLYRDELAKIFGCAELNSGTRVVCPENRGDANTLTLLRRVVKNNMDSLVAEFATKPHRPAQLDLTVLFFTAVFRKVFPSEEVSRGTGSLYYKLLLAALKSSVVDDGEVRAEITRTLESRIKQQQSDRNKLAFEYDEGSGAFIPNQELREILEQVGEGAVNCLC